MRAPLFLTSPTFLQSSPHPSTPLARVGAGWNVEAGGISGARGFRGAPWSIPARVCSAPGTFARLLVSGHWLGSCPPPFFLTLFPGAGGCLFCWAIVRLYRNLHSWWITELVNPGSWKEQKSPRFAIGPYFGSVLARGDRDENENFVLHVSVLHQSLAVIVF